VTPSNALARDIGNKSIVRRLRFLRILAHVGAKIPGQFVDSSDSIRNAPNERATHYGRSIEVSAG
jgi:hypothetical protein